MAAARRGAGSRSSEDFARSVLPHQRRNSNKARMEATRAPLWPATTSQPLPWCIAAVIRVGRPPALKHENSTRHSRR